jgi:PBP1b-binding outer membrane lipoprotein LpoB
MFGRSKVLLLLSLPLLLLSCSTTPEQEVKVALGEAFEALQTNDVDAYMQHLDFGQPLDSAFFAVCADAVRQEMLSEGHELQVVRWKVPQVNFESDSVALAFYTLYLANGDSLCKGQKMVCIDGVWKLRMRE